jgi:hypothetical protein
MEVTMSKTMLTQLLSEASELGAKRALAEAGTIKPFISKQEAYKKYGKANVERWILEQLITARKDGGHSAKWRIERSEIDAVAMASNRPSYLQVKQRS